MRKSIIKLSFLLVAIISLISCEEEDNNQPPKIEDQTFLIDENSSQGTIVGQVIATDSDGNVLTYEIMSGNINEAFAISSEDGIITVQNENEIDYEKKSFFTLLIEVNDKENESNTATITININNQEISKNGIILYLPFNGNAEDETNNNFDGVVYGATLTLDRNNNENSAYYFDGIDDYIEIGDKDQLSFPGNNNFTISLWAEVNSFDRNQFIVSKFYSSGDNKEYSINYTSSLNSYVFGINDGGSSIDYLSSNYTQGWHHIVGMKDNDKIYLYIDNVLVSEKTYTTYQLSSFAKFMIGAVDMSSTSPDGFFHGNIDDIVIYNRLLTNDEIKVLFKE